MYANNLVNSEISYLKIVLINRNENKLIDLLNLNRKM